jgi:hypothetical protein
LRPSRKVSIITNMNETLTKPEEKKLNKDLPGYSAVHWWIKKEAGKPLWCNRCGVSGPGRYEWANISKEYKRELSDWMRLCVSCHRREAFEVGENTTWNKGKKVQSNTGRTHFRKGQHYCPENEFKKGVVSNPSRKYLTERACIQCGGMFQPLDATRQYCGYECYWKSLKGVPGKRTLPDKVCVHCGNTFHPRQSTNPSLYCGLPCTNDAKRKVRLIPSKLITVETVS